MHIDCALITFRTCLVKSFVTPYLQRENKLYIYYRFIVHFLIGLTSSCWCLHTSLTLVSGGSPMIPLVVHQPAYPSIWPAAASFQQDLTTNPVVTTWCVQLKLVCVWMLQRGHSGDRCVLASTLCKYDLRKGDLFVLSWARVQRMMRRSISSELLRCGRSVRSILLDA